MKRIKDSFIYQYTDKVYNMKDKISNFVNGDQYETITYDMIAEYIDDLPKMYKDSYIINAIKLFKDGRIILKFTNSRDMNLLPPFMPFVMLSKNNEISVIVDLSNTSFKETKTKNDKIVYSINMRQLYSILISAYFNTIIGEYKSVFAHNTSVILADAWAKMFCKVLNKAISLNLNQERYDAYKYLAVKYFMINMEEVTETIAEQIARETIKNPKNQYIENMNLQISKKYNNDIFTDFNTFCTAIFDFEISGINPKRNENAILNTATYISLFIKMYEYKTLYALDSVPYFLYLFISTNNSDNTLQRKIFEDIMVNPKKYVEALKYI